MAIGPAPRNNPIIPSSRTMLLGFRVGQQNASDSRYDFIIMISLIDQGKNVQSFHYSPYKSISDGLIVPPLLNRKSPVSLQVWTFLTTENPAATLQHVT